MGFGQKVGNFVDLFPKNGCQESGSPSASEDSKNQSTLNYMAIDMLDYVAESDIVDRSGVPMSRPHP